MKEKRVAIIGVGYSKFDSVSPGLSYKEMVYEAAVKAYKDANVEPGEIGSFVSCAEDLWEGTSIFDEYTPDQLGAVLKPVHTITADGMFGLISAQMQVLTGQFELVAVEAHSKASNIENINRIVDYATDPIYQRPFGLNPNYIAGLEMARFLYESGNTREQCAEVVVKNKTNALLNPNASFGEVLEISDVLGSRTISEPLKSMDISPSADGAIVMVLGSEKKAKAKNRNPVWINGSGWCSDSYSLEYRDWRTALYAKKSAEMAYKMAGIKEPVKKIQFAEIDDTFSYKELQHIEALGLCKKGMAGKLLKKGFWKSDGYLPVNVSGGSLGCGNLLEANGIMRVLEVVLQLRGEAGKRQIKDVRVGLAQCWRGLPTATGAVMILSKIKY